MTCGQMRLLEKRADADGLSYYQMMENAGTEAARMIMEYDAYQAAVKEDAPGVMYAEAKAAEDNVADVFPVEPLPADAAGIADMADAMGATNVADVLRRGVIRSTRDASARKAYIFCGKGNNGGDGFVVARLMCDAGYDITVILVDGKPKTRDAVTNFDLLEKRSVRILDMDSNNRALMELEGMPDIIVDAMYGTGFHGKLGSNGLKAAIYINRHARKNIDGQSVMPVTVVALDIPSGLGGDLVDERDLDENSVTAHHTITFHAKKPVHLQKFAEKYCGKISVADIGIDEERLWNIDF